jgi:hypothetical protein
MDVDSIYTYRTHTVIDCTAPLYGTESTKLDQVQAHLALTDQIANLLMDDDWIFAFVARSTFSSLAPILFDTGASLAISPKRGDFVEEPTPLNRSTTLGGMAHNLEIKGIGTVVWTFNAKDGTYI